VYVTQNCAHHAAERLPICRKNKNKVICPVRGYLFLASIPFNHPINPEKYIFHHNQLHTLLTKFLVTKRIGSPAGAK
jgi:hypothetical protein